MQILGLLAIVGCAFSLGWLTRPHWGTSRRAQRRRYSR